MESRLKNPAFEDRTGVKEITPRKLKTGYRNKRQQETCKRRRTKLIELIEKKWGVEVFENHEIFVEVENGQYIEYVRCLDHSGMIKKIYSNRFKPNHTHFCSLCDPQRRENSKIGFHKKHGATFKRLSGRQ